MNTNAIDVSDVIHKVTFAEIYCDLQNNIIQVLHDSPIYYTVKFTYHLKLYCLPFHLDCFS